MGEKRGKKRSRGGADEADEEANATVERESAKHKSCTEIGQGSAGVSVDDDSNIVHGGYSPDNSGAAGTQLNPVPKRPKLQHGDLELETTAAWDYENAEIPTELEHNLARKKIMDKLSQSGLSEPSAEEFFITVGYLDSIKPKMDGALISHANQFDRPKHYCTAKNQASDRYMYKWAKAWLLEHPEPRNILFISGDGGFSSTLDLLTKAGHRVILITNNVERDPRAYLQWTWRDFLGLPPERIYKNESEKKQALAKKARSRAHMKALTKSRGEDRTEALKKAETDPVPSSIVQLADGSVQISIMLENHCQKPVIRDIDDDAVYVVGDDDRGDNKKILEEIGRRIGKSPKHMRFNRVGEGDNNKWTLVVKDMEAREAFLKLVKARV